MQSETSSHKIFKGPNLSFNILALRISPDLILCYPLEIILSGDGRRNAKRYLVKSNETYPALTNTAALCKSKKIFMYFGESNGGGGP